MLQHDLERAYMRLQQENGQLRKEIERLRTRLVKYEPDIQNTWCATVQELSKEETEVLSTGFPTVHQKSSSKEKIALFRSLFQGRTDVYARRWEGKGKAGYIFACANDGDPHLCHKPRVKCSSCSHRSYRPLTDTVIADHLNKETLTTIGIYPLLHDETCLFLAIDFDKGTWQEDVLAFIKVCREQQIPIALERSRSGNGAHVWIFFEEPVSASLARNMGCTLLTYTMEQCNLLGLGSYDRLFPNQDTMPIGGLGNLIALPLQGKSRLKGNSVFINDKFAPYPDQWAFLSSMEKLKRSDVELFVNEAAKKGGFLGVQSVDRDGEDRPWEIQLNAKQTNTLTGPFPKRITIVLSNMIYLPKENLSPSLFNHIRRMAAFQNPEFYEAQAMRRSTYDKPRIINCAEEFPQFLALPRGCIDQVLQTLKECGIEVRLIDKRNSGDELQVVFHGELHELQKKAVESLLAYETGILSATTAFGKTVVAAWMRASRGTNTLILVHRKQLMEQWREKLASFLELPPKEIGQIGGGKNKRTGKIDIALLQSLNRQGEIKEFVTDYGHVIVDECHHLSAFTFEQILKRVKAKYVLGLTATPIRKDGHHPIIQMQCGSIRYRVDSRAQAKSHPFEHFVIPQYTSFQMAKLGDSTLSIQETYASLIEDKKRNDLIFDDLLMSLEQGRTPLLLTERTAHVEYFANRLKPFVKHVLVLRGGMGKRKLAEVMKQLVEIPDDEERVIVATGKFIGEGFDDPRLDTLFLAMPISWKGTLQQYAGRLHRLHPDKRIVKVYDYVDHLVPMLQRMYEKRKKGYENMGYQMRKQEEIWIQESLDL
jgi:superfamily II DNA or RNA helicase